MSQPMTDQSMSPGEALAPGSQSDQLGRSGPRLDTEVAQRAPRKPYWTSRWRIRYRPGEWLVLSGPTALVMLQAAAAQSSDLITTVWEDLLAAASIDELAANLAAFRLAEVPDLAVLFWGPDGMRSLVRGRVMIVDPRSDIPVANGEGIQTWTEIGMGHLERVRIMPDDPSTTDPGDDLDLPLVIGAVHAGEVLLDASAKMQVASPQVTHLLAPTASVGESLPPAESSLSDSDAPAPESAVESAAGGADRPAAPVADTGSVVAPSGQEEPSVGAGDIADTMISPELPGMPESPPPGRLPRTVAAILRPSSGERVEVDRPVLIGRAPASDRVTGDQVPHLITVYSPNQDISRTHVQVMPDRERVMISDMYSTNGTILVQPDGRRQELHPGHEVAAAYGSIIDLGDGVSITVDRPEPGFHQ